MSEQPSVPGDFVVVKSIDYNDASVGIEVGDIYAVCRKDADHVFIRIPKAPEGGYPMTYSQVRLATHAEPAVGALPGDLTLRDYFAAHALSRCGGSWVNLEDLANLAYAAADAMLKERSK